MTRSPIGPSCSLLMSLPATFYSPKIASWRRSCRIRKFCQPAVRAVQPTACGNWVAPGRSGPHRRVHPPLLARPAKQRTSQILRAVMSNVFLDMTKLISTRLMIRRSGPAIWMRSWPGLPRLANRHGNDLASLCLQLRLGADRTVGGLSHPGAIGSHLDFGSWRRLAVPSGQVAVVRDQ
jgi:hypothetical protein